MAVEQMNETPNLLIQLGEALRPFGSLVFLMLLCGGAVWVVMAFRFNREDHHRFEASVDNGFNRCEANVNRGFSRSEANVETLRKESWKDSKQTRDEIAAGRKESREDSRETKALLRSIDSRLDRIIDRMPPDQPG